MTEFVLVSCSKSKLDGIHRGEDLYEPSDIFGKRRTFAEREGVHWGILSAKHGYLRSWEAIENYERHISDRTPVWGAFVLDDLLADLEYYGVDQVTVLAGKRYVDPLVAELEAQGYDVLDYNRNLRSGERKRELKEANAPGEQETLVPDGGRDGFDREDTDEGKHCEVCGLPLDGETTTVPTGEAHVECADADPMSGDELMPDGGTDGGNRPSACENPHAECHRDPDLEVRWAEDYTAENRYNQMWLCEPCYAMLERGTRVAVINMETRDRGFENEW